MSQINQLYLDYLGRPASPKEIAFYEKRFGSDVDREETLRFIKGAAKSEEISQERADELTAPFRLNYENVDFLANQLQEQYDSQVAAGLDPYPYQDQLPGFFRAQAAKLAANNVQSIYDLQQQDGNIVNTSTGELLKDVVLRPSWKTDPEAYKFRDTVELEERGGGKYTRWGKDLSVTGQGDYGLTFVDNKPVFTPYWKDTQNFSVEDAIKTAAAIAAIYYGGQYLLAEGGAAAGAGTGAAAGADAATTGLSLLADDAAFIAADAAQLAAQNISASQITQTLVSSGVSPSVASAASSFASSGLAAGDIASNLITSATPGTANLFTATPADFTAAGITTGGQGVPVTEAQLKAIQEGKVAGTTFAEQVANAQALLPGGSLLDDVVDYGSKLSGLLDGSQQQQTQQQQRRVMGGQPRGVDFSPLYRNTQVGLLPGAERFRRSLI